MKIQHCTRALAALAILAAAIVLPGCSGGSEENPITPDKMEQIRQQEANQRGNFSPKGGPPPSSAGGSGTNQ